MTYDDYFALKFEMMRKREMEIDDEMNRICGRRNLMEIFHDDDKENRERRRNGRRQQ